MVLERQNAPSSPQDTPLLPSQTLDTTQKVTQDLRSLTPQGTGPIYFLTSILHASQDITDWILNV